ncbi:hypothetical protein P6709_08465 [Jeotgalibacillus sp. ET6]|uniref:hypothetical protein n=1 Tax=Jeotgalibacillus sp. ET6 TaxID=3037260 RepID=UPI0024189F9E|nr:hypothetical protein [Jeotgalibacillus sp. ET6]MDG5471779.1 hypothetical protein [Jeotgalibacillus sp. ET6]
MLSKQSEKFILELRMYLISKGKKDQEIDEITEELEIHLTRAEEQGKDIANIVGKSPRKYMKSLSNEMKTDRKQMAVLIPMMILLIAAYFSFGPAIEGTFALSSIILWFALGGAAIGVFVYGLVMCRVLPSLYKSFWGMVLIFGANIFVTGIFVMLLLWMKSHSAQPFFVATPLQNTIIIAICLALFIASAIYTKTWITIFVPAFIGLQAVSFRYFSDEINSNPNVFIIGIIVLTLIVGSGMIFLYKRKIKVQN